MSIDWFTVGAQVVNFLILVWLLKKLLFRPIMNAMERRELGVEGRLRQAHERMEEAEALRSRYENRLQQFQQERDGMLTQARQQAESEKNDLLQRLNEDMQHKRQQFRDELREEQRELGAQIGRTLAEKSVLLCDHILGRLADSSLERRLIDRFLQHLDKLPPDESDAVRQTIRQHPATIITRFPVDERTRTMLNDWFGKFSPGCTLTFAENEALICGIALEAGGRSWEWTVARYLGELETELLKIPGEST